MTYALLFALLQEVPTPAEAWSKCGSEIEWFFDGVKLVDGESIGARSSKPTADRDDLWEDALEKAKETKRLILWYVPRTSGGHMNRAAVLDGYIRAVAFTDPDVVALVKRKFVPLRMSADRSIGKDTGIKPFDFVEPGFVFVDPDGKIVHTIDRLRTFSSDWFLRALTLVLEKFPDYNAPSGDTAEELLLGGDYAKALEKGAPAGRVYRRMGLGAKALEALKGSDDVVERARVYLGLGDFDAARRELEAAVKAGGDRAAEAHYFLALVDWRSGREEAARSRWAELAGQASPWAWRAAGNLVKAKDTLMDGPIVHEFEEVEWAPEASLKAAPTRTMWSRGEKDVDDVAKRAVEWLIRHQRSDGSWADSRYVYCDSPKILPNVFVATAALGAQALLEWRDVDPKRCDAAREKAEAYAMDDKHLNRGQNEENYADAYRLLYLVRKVELLKDAEAPKLMKEFAAKLAANQDKSGQWAHEYPNPFCTAAVVYALQRARAAGAEVDDSAIEKGCAVLKKTRSEDGRQPYGGLGKASRAKDTSARAAMADVTLLAAKLIEPKDLEGTVAMYWEYVDRSEAVRVCDYHSDGELGGFFFWHGFMHTVMAASALDKEKREEYFAKARAHILKIPEWDGSFIDSHELGKGYGTAMALISLRRVAKP